MELLEPPHALKVTLFKALDEIDENWRNYKGLICLGSQPGQDDSFFFKKTITTVWAQAPREWACETAWRLPRP